MFKVGDIVNIKKCFSNISFYTDDLLVIKEVKSPDYVLLDNKYNYNTKLWTEFIEINPLNDRIRKTRRIKENISHE